MNEIQFSIEEGVGTIVFNRPQKKNAFTGEMRHRLWSILRAPETQDLNVVVLRAEGGTFCGGVDLNEIAEHRTRHPVSSVDFWSVFRQAKPVLICAVNGLALGLGAGIAVSCDLVIASDDAKFGYPEIGHGLVPSFTTVGLQEVIGMRRAFELLITGRRFGAQEALDFGILNEVVPGDRLQQRAYEIASGIAASSTHAVHTSKRYFYESTEMPFNLGIRAAERVVEMTRARKEVQKNAAAFIAKGAAEKQA
jgi:enoyl-CoA hydratase/carnithine racemase